jgi:hypothetical protein
MEEMIRLTNRPESQPMGQAWTREIVVSTRDYERLKTYPQSAGRELVKRFTSAMVMNPEASSSNASKIGCTHLTSMYLNAHPSGFIEVLTELVPIPRTPLVSEECFSR